MILLDSAARVRNTVRTNPLSYRARAQIRAHARAPAGEEIERFSFYQSRLF